MSSGEGFNGRTTGGPCGDTCVLFDDPSPRGRVLARFPQARAVAYTDDGYIKAKLRVVLQVLVELKRILKEDGVLELNVTKTSVLPKGTSQQEAFDVCWYRCVYWC